KELHRAPVVAEVRRMSPAAGSGIASKGLFYCREIADDPATEKVDADELRFRMDQQLVIAWPEHDRVGRTRFGQATQRSARRGVDDLKLGLFAVIGPGSTQDVFAVGPANAQHLVAGREHGAAKKAQGGGVPQAESVFVVEGAQRLAVGWIADLANSPGVLAARQ